MVHKPKKLALPDINGMFTRVVTHLRDEWPTYEAKPARLAAVMGRLSEILRAVLHLPLSERSRLDIDYDWLIDFPKTIFGRGWTQRKGDLIQDAYCVSLEREPAVYGAGRINSFDSPRAKKFSGYAKLRLNATERNLVEEIEAHPLIRQAFRLMLERRVRRVKKAMLLNKQLLEFDRKDRECLKKWEAAARSGDAAATKQYQKQLKIILSKHQQLIIQFMGAN